MGAGLKRELGDAMAFTQPKGGLFFWARLTGANGKTKDAVGFSKKAIAQGVAFVPDAPFLRLTQTCQHCASSSPWPMWRRLKRALLGLARRVEQQVQ
jgi:DNA-binding transcriptional MocR family regulator